MRQVTSSTWKRLKRLEQAKTAIKYVGGWPDIIYDLDEWSALAAPMQAELFRGHVEQESELVRTPHVTR